MDPAPKRLQKFIGIAHAARCLGDFLNLLFDFIMRKKHLPLFLVPLLLSLIGCQPSTLDFRNAGISNGKIYSGSSNSPFSGLVVNVPAEKFMGPHAGFDKVSNMLNQVTGGYMSYVGRLCDIHVSDGVLDGAVTCRRPEEENTDIDASFKHNQLTEQLKLIGQNQRGERFRTEVNMQDGQPDGTQRSYSVDNNVLVHTVQWQNGALFGPEEVFDKKTGNRIREANIIGGKYDGEMISYDLDGKVLRRLTFSNGVQQLDESFDPGTGKMTGQIPYHYDNVHGLVVHGIAKQWDADGTLISEKTYKFGTEVTAAPIGGGSLNQCVDDWVTAFRKEQGADAVVSHDQLTEWESWCKQGKLP